MSAAKRRAKAIKRRQWVDRLRAKHRLGELRDGAAARERSASDANAAASAVGR